MSEDSISIIFIQPSEIFGHNANIPTSFIEMAAVLREAAIKVEILDARLDNLSVYQTIDILKKKNFDIIGITGLNCAYKYVKDFSIEFKREFPEKPLIAGGCFIMSQPEMILSRIPIDVACIGEGEEVIVDLVTRLVNKQNISDINNLAYIKEGKFFQTPKKRIENLDKFPLPAYDLLNMNRYLNSPNADPFLVSTGRGCINHCYYCSNPYPQVVRPSPSRIVEHFDLLHNRYRVKNFAFSEENAFYPQDWLVKICERLVELDRSYNFGAGGCPNHVTEEIAQAMASVKGTAKAGIAVEHWNPQIQKGFFRIQQSEGIIPSLEIFKKYNIPVIGFNILWGHPKDTPKSFKETLKKSLKIVKKYSIESLSLATLVVYPNSQFLKDALKKNKITDYEDYMYSMIGYGPYVNLTDVDDDEFRKFMAKLTAINYSKDYLRKILFSNQKGIAKNIRERIISLIKLSKTLKRLFLLNILLLLPKFLKNKFRSTLEEAFYAPIYNPNINHYHKMSCLQEILNLPEHSKLTALYTKNRKNLSKVLNSVREANIDFKGFVNNNTTVNEVYNYPVIPLENIDTLNPDYILIFSQEYNDQIQERIFKLIPNAKVIKVDSNYEYKYPTGFLNTYFQFTKSK